MPSGAIDVEAVRAYVAERDVPCPGCGYNLRGLTGERCPECNEALEVRIGLAEPRMGAFIACVVGLAVGAGAAGLWELGALVMCLRLGWPGGREVFWIMGYPPLMLMLEGAALWWLVSAAGRRWLRSRPPGGARAAALGAWGLTMGLFIVWLLGVLRI